MKNNIISLDIGTTNLKFSLFEENKLIVAKEMRYQKLSISEDEYQLDSHEIWTIVIQGLLDMIHDYSLDTLEIVLTSAMHTVQLLNDSNQLNGPLYTWADLTGKELVDKNDIDLIKNYAKTGTPIHSMNPYFKISWLAKMQTFSKIASIKDYLLFRLTNKWVIDESCAASSGMYNGHSGEWDKEILADLSITMDQLPKIVKGNLPLKIANHIKEKLGILDGIVYPGYSDGVSSNGAFLALSNAAVLSVGTSHAVRVITNEFIIDEEVMNFCYKIEQGRYIVGFPSNNGGNVLEWILSCFNSNFSELEQIVSQRLHPNGVFLPYVNGERAPIWNSSAEASIVRLNRETNRKQLLFTLVTGLFFNIKWNVEALQKIQTFDKVALTGGLAKSEVFCQFLSDILELPIYLPIEKNIETLGSINLLKQKTLPIKYRVLYPNPFYLMEEYQEFKKVVEDLYCL